VTTPEAKQPILPYMRMPKLSENLVNFEKAIDLRKERFLGYSRIVSLTKCMLQELSLFLDNYVRFPLECLYLKIPVSNINDVSLTS